MKYIIDAKMLQAYLADMETPAERGKYILDWSIRLAAGTSMPEWCSKIPKPRSKAALGNYTETFEEFWSEYPKCNNKINKGGAFAVWKELVKDYGEYTLLISCQAALLWQKESIAWQNEGSKYIPKPETYLLKRKWEDERPETNTKTERYQDMDGIWRTR